MMTFDESLFSEYVDLGNVLKTVQKTWKDFHQETRIVREYTVAIEEPIQCGDLNIELGWRQI